ncbi:MAG: pirin family protein [Actinobacteria bacterium]|nr:MAG: pirin family protein [Actinomycetota bacterium]TMK96841.1 MAG: pirin family protein [Actinomycetota bacterium]
MIQIRRDSEIYEKEGGWFHARWHFSFDEYRDLAWMQFGSLRVFNDDRLVPGVAWPMHPHRDIEGITYVVEGQFQHADSLKGDDYPVLPAGSVQRMTLGSGAWHSEQNASDTEPMRFIQLWIMPRERGLEPSVEQKAFTKGDRTGRLLRVISPDGGDGVLVHQDARVYVSSLPTGSSVSQKFDHGMGGYLYLIGGSVRLNGGELATGDAAKFWDEPEVTLEAREASELILIEVRLD